MRHPAVFAVLALALSGCAVAQATPEPGDCDPRPTSSTAASPPKTSTPATPSGQVKLIPRGPVEAGSPLPPCDEQSPTTKPAPPAAGSPGARRPLPGPTGCTTTARTSVAARVALDTAKAGHTICLVGALTGKLAITKSGREGAPIRVLGGGVTSVSGIDVRASWVHVSGFNVVKPGAPGVSLTGTHLTLEDTTVTAPTGGDGDGIRFFGSNIVIRHNTIGDTDNSEGHADAIQNFSTRASDPETRDVLIERNRMTGIANICLIAEGPDSEAGDGTGKGNTARITYRGNFCQAGSAQAVLFDDVQDWVIEGNEVGPGVDHAWAIQNGSTGGTVRNNRIHESIECEVGMDSSSRAGYQGPAPECGP